MIILLISSKNIDRIFSNFKLPKIEKSYNFYIMIIQSVHIQHSLEYKIIIIILLINSTNIKY